MTFSAIPWWSSFLLKATAYLLIPPGSSNEHHINPIESARSIPYQVIAMRATRWRAMSSRLYFREVVDAICDALSRSRMLHSENGRTSLSLPCRNILYLYLCKKTVYLIVLKSSRDPLLLSPWPTLDLSAQGTCRHCLETIANISKPTPYSDILIWP